MSMYPLTLNKIAEVTGGTLVCDGAEAGETCITGVCRDNREVKPGYLFVCFKGAAVDGHSFAAKAIEAGAAAVLAEKPVDAKPYVLVESTFKALKQIAAYYRTLLAIPVVGIVGSVGKTSAKEMTAIALSAKYNVYKTGGNLNNEIGVPLSVLGIGTEHTAAVIEMGISDFGEMSRIAAIVKPDICIMTVIGSCHLENLKDLAGVLKAKSEVLDFMPANGAVIVNGDDDYLRGMQAPIRKITFGMEKDNDYRYENVMQNGFHELKFDFVKNGVSVPVTVPGFGKHLAAAAAAALTAADYCGAALTDAAEKLLGYVPVSGRAEVFDTGYITVINDCYNANPNSVKASVEALGMVSGRKVAVLGDMKELGEQSGALHREVGLAVGHANIDSLLTQGTEAENIYKGFLSGNFEGQAKYFPEREALLVQLPTLIQKGDTVLVKASHSMHFEELVEELKKLRGC